MCPFLVNIVMKQGSVAETQGLQIQISRTKVELLQEANQMVDRSLGSQTKLDSNLWACSHFPKLLWYSVKALRIPGIPEFKLQISHWSAGSSLLDQ